MENDEWLCQQNIERFRALRAAASDETQRATLSELLAQEEAKLQQFTSAPPAAEHAEDPVRNPPRLAAPSLGAAPVRNGESRFVAAYRCYFFGQPAASSFGAPSSIEAADNLSAESDDEARRRAETLYRQRRNQIHGYELWQGTRLVHRQLGSSGEADVTKHDFRGSP